MSEHTILVISPHADDATIFCGGYIALATRQKKRVVIIRVTDDDQDGCNPDRKQNIDVNRKECEEAYKTLGVSETVHMEYHSDFLLREDYYGLRDRFIQFIRIYRPQEALCFGLDGPGEDNPDHTVVSKAFHDAVWAAGFPLHCPEHTQQGLKPYIVPRILNFYRNPQQINVPVDISAVLEQKTKAIKAHKNVMENFVRQIRLKASCSGIESELLEAPVEQLVEMLVPAQAQELGKAFDIPYAELFAEQKDDIIEMLRGSV